MLTEKTVKPPRRWSNAAMVICLLLLMIGTSPVVGAQESPTSSQEDTQMRRKFELHTKVKGKAIAEGRNTTAPGRVPVERYTVAGCQTGGNRCSEV
jgi:hypothetical protein